MNWLPPPRRPGPSDDYKQLLRGAIEPEEYVRRLKADVDGRSARPTRPATRIGRTVLLPGGAVVQLSRIQRVLFALGLRSVLSTTPHHERRSR